MLTRFILVSPGIAIVLLALSNGGYFPIATATAAIAALALALVWVTFTHQPRLRLGRGGAVAAGALVAFAAWTLLSGTWSDATSRAILEFDRVLLYVGAFVLFALLGRSGRRARILVIGLAVATVVVCIGAIAVWLLPKTFPTDPLAFERYRLSWPTSYWNATGLLAGLGTIFALHFSASLDEQPWVRAAGAAAIPLTVATLWFTVSRGAAAATVIAVVVYLVAGARRGLVTAVPVAALSAVAALVVANGVGDISTAVPTPQALDDGRRVALELALVAVFAGAARLLLAGVPDRRLAEMRLPAIGRRTAATAAGAVAVLLAAAFLSLGGAARVSHAYQTFVSPTYIGADVPPTQRFTQLENNDRVAQWKIALYGLRDHPFGGTGAGTYVLAWQHDRATDFSIVDAHSLYAEQAGELGAPGLALLLLALGTMAGGLVLRVVRGGRERAIWAALLAGVAAWLLHAGVDWDWEMPALTVWVFAAGGLALSLPRESGAGRTIRPIVPILAAGGCIVLAITPFLVLRSQHHLLDSLDAFRANNCAAAMRAASASTDALSSRPEPLELKAYCLARTHRPAQALEAVADAVRRDPGDWEFHYAQAIVQGVARRDPRPAARAALRRNPREPRARDLVAQLTDSNPQHWHKAAVNALLDVPGYGRGVRILPQRSASP